MDTAYGSAQPAPAAAAAPVPAQPAVEEDVITQLERLGALKAQGLLTDEEFAAQKAKIMGL
ncbi:MAG TPA: SHOCT domain-containing protein [Promineifilum sp.]